MHILILSGFLGSGKTSLLIPFAQKLSGKGKKVAILENEIGQLGIDDLYLKENNLHVKEIYHGCICCSLKKELVNALFELEREYTPEIVVMEPTGAADPYLTLSSLAEYPGKVDSKTMVSIVDAERFEDIMDQKIDLVIDGIRCADLVVLNKIDLISSDKLATLKQTIKNMHPSAEIMSVSIHDQTLLNTLFEQLEAKLFSSHKKEEQIRIRLEKKGVSPTVCSKKFEFTADDICLSEIETKKYFEDKIYTIALLLDEAGAHLIGNIKLIIQSDRDGYILISTTSFSRYPEVSGKLPSGYSTIIFHVNAMVYGIEQECLEGIVKQVFPYQPAAA